MGSKSSKQKEIFPVIEEKSKEICHVIEKKPKENDKIFNVKVVDTYEVEDIIVDRIDKILFKHLMKNTQCNKEKINIVSLDNKTTDLDIEKMSQKDLINLGKISHSIGVKFEECMKPIDKHNKTIDKIKEVLEKNDYGFNNKTMTINYESDVNLENLFSELQSFGYVVESHKEKMCNNIGCSNCSSNRSSNLLKLKI